MPASPGPQRDRAVLRGAEFSQLVGELGADLQDREGVARPTGHVHVVAVAENKVHVHDFHATILHLLGMDHTKLTFRHGGRDYRLTDVHGKIVRDILV